MCLCVYARIIINTYMYVCMYVCMYHFDTLDQSNARAHISHIVLLASLKNLVIGNRDMSSSMFKLGK